MTAQMFGVDDRGDKDVTLDMLDYKYIDECNNVKEMERILKVLRSAKDGYYPHLIRHCENKLTNLDPKNKYLRKESPAISSRDLPSEDRDQLTNGLSDWSKEMKNELKSEVNGVHENNLPPIRSSKTMKGNRVKKGDVGSKKTERIRSADYKSWDKYDVDEECKKVDEQNPVVHETKTSIPHKVSAEGMTDEEREMRAGREKDKGNEAFKAGDFEEALAYYSRSISLIRTAASINNRALAYLRLERWEDARMDCDQVLMMEEDNLKAKLRRASSLKEMKMYQDAKLDLDFVLEKEPNNARAKKLLAEVEEKIPKRGHRMEISEVEEDEDEINEETSPAREQIQQFQEPASTQEPTPTEDSASIPKSTPAQNPTPYQDSATQDPRSTESSSPADPASSSTATSSPEPPPQKEFSSTATNLSSNDQTTLPRCEPLTQGNIEVDAQEIEPEIPQSPLPMKIEAIKTSAGEFYRSGQYGEASGKYTQAITQLKMRMKKESDCNYSHALAVLFNNRAACMLKSGNDKSCIQDCDSVLELKPADVKALVRRGSAYEHMEKYVQAYNDFRQAQVADWSASQAQDGANRVAKHLRDLHGPGWKDKLSGEFQKELQPDVTREQSNKVPASKPKKKTEKKLPSTTSVKAEEMEAKRQKIRQDLFTKLKSEGNEMVRSGKYNEAVERYTKCINICPEEVASYTNRALCFLKLKKDLSAVHDCTEAIKLDEGNVKAHFRRGQARRNLGMMTDAEKDFVKVIELDPKNRSAKNDLDALRTEIKSTTKRKIEIEEVSEDEEEPEESGKEPDAFVSSQVKAEEDVARDESWIQAPRDELPSPCEDDDSGSSEVKNEQLDTEEGGKGKPQNEESTLVLPEVPEKMTPYEFGNLWNSIQPKTHVAAYKIILDKVSLDQIPVMVSNKTTDHVIVTFAHIAQSHIDSSEFDRAFLILQHLARAQRFDMAAMFLGQSDKNIVGEVFASLANSVESKKVSFDISDVNRLRACYKI
ncbi:sperm-associated antigen 1-like [Clavelina lepadiformis]|uniref:sperm-associated antigen 1-like n=1 Tax=Clavelina lepadiformis TaxID=159417 RepID=UPI0040430E57